MIEVGLASPGQRLPSDLQRDYSARLGTDLSDVRVHTGGLAEASATLLGARAFTHGNHLVFGPGRFAPGHPEGRRLLVHELAHIAQQRRNAAVAPSGQTEAEAKAIANAPPSEIAPPRLAARGLQLDPLSDAEIAALQAEGALGRLTARLQENENETGQLVYSPEYVAELQRENLSLQRAILALQQQPSQTGPAAATARSAGAAGDRRASVAAPATTSSVAATTDTDRLSLSQLEARVQQETEALLALDPGSGDYATRSAELSRLEGILQSRQASVDQSAAGVQTLADAVRSAPPLGAQMQEVLAITGFTAGFLTGAQAEIPPASFADLDRETRASPATFQLGNLAGLLVGAAREVWGAIEGLVELAAFLQSFSAQGIMQRISEEAVAYASDPQGYVQHREEQLQQARDIAAALLQLAQNIHDDPAFLLVHGNELGLIVGHQAGRWFTDDFMHRSTFDKGEFIGENEGRIIIEIALLFVGPEEWLARGGAVIGEGVRVSGELMEAVRVAMEGIPALRRILEARGLLHAAEDTVEAGRALGGAGHAIEDLSRATHDTGELAHAAGGAGDAAGTTGHAADTATHAAGDTADAAADAPDNVIDLQAERERRAALARARSQQVVRQRRLAAGAERDTPVASSTDEDIAEVFQQEQSRGVDSDRALGPGDADDVRTSRHARLADADRGSPSQILGQRLRAEGLRPPGPGYEAHHIVPIDDPRAARLQQFLENRGIDINSADNGVWLPRGADTPNVGGEFRHEFTFDDEYFETIEEILTAPTESGRPPGPATVRMRLRTMRSQMMDGRMPSP